jgi:hypothetical protein
MWKKPYKRTYAIKRPNSITLNMVEDIRKDFKLAIQDGVDNVSFYDDDSLLSEEIISYKRIIYKLAKT